MEILGARYSRTRTARVTPVGHKWTDRSVVNGHSNPENSGSIRFYSLSWVKFLFYIEIFDTPRTAGSLTGPLPSHVGVSVR